MIKVKVIEDFTLRDFDKLKNIVRNRSNVKGKLFKDDIFECSEEMARYLTGENILGKTVVEVIEVEPKKEEIKKTIKELEGFDSINTISDSKKEKPKKKKK